MDARVLERKLAAILSADVEGYSRLMGDDEVATVRAITEYRALIARAVTQHGGRVVDAPGDNVLAEFSSVVEAVRSAVDIQRELRSRNADVPASRRMQFRIGINLGDLIVEGERLYGTASTSPRASRASPTAAASASRARRTTRSKERFRSITNSSASTPSRTSRVPCACTGFVWSRARRPAPRWGNGTCTAGWAREGLAWS